MLNIVAKACFGEFQLKMCGFDHSPVDDFLKSEWQTSTKSVIYFLYRWIIAILFMVASVYSMVEHKNSGEHWGHYFIYLTNWSINLSLLTTVMGAVFVTQWHCLSTYSDNQLNKMPLAFKMHWALQNTATVLATIVSIVYWGFIYDPKIYVIDATNLLTHAINSCVMLFDILIVAYPVKLMHVWMPIVVGGVYTIFGVIYYLAGGTNRYGKRFIYNVLDWSELSKSITVTLAILILMLAVQFFAYLMYRLRKFTHRKFTVLNTQDVIVNFSEGVNAEQNKTLENKKK